MHCNRHWLAASKACEGFSLEDFSREISVFIRPIRTAAAGPRIPVDTQYLRDQKRGLVETVAKAIWAGIPAKRLIAVLLSLGLAGSVASTLVERVQESAKSREAVPVEQILREIPDFIVPQQLPVPTLEVPRGKPGHAPSPFKKDEPTAPGPSRQQIASYVAGHEGSKKVAYRDSKGKATIGVGHLVQDGDRELFKRLFGDGADVDGIIGGKVALTQEQVDTLFAHDLESHIDRTRRIFPRLDSYPESVQAALVDGVYRGDLPGSPNTIKLINAGKWGEAADEYLNSREFRSAQSDRLSRGVALRMQENSDRMRSMAD